MNQTTRLVNTNQADMHGLTIAARYIQLTKPRVVALMVLTAFIGMCLATADFVSPGPLLWGNGGIALCAASAAVINHIVDRRVDALMIRTQQRPVAIGQIAPFRALLFALLLGVTGFVILFCLVNPLTAWLTLTSLMGYAVVYTLILKRATPQNIVIGGLAGASPPLLGWTAVTGHIDGDALLLVLIIFAWTPPHFWSLAIHRKSEYARAGIPMLPVTHGEAFTRLQILLYTVIMSIISLLPFLTGMSGMVYLFGALVLALRFLCLAVALVRNRGVNTPMRLFRYSITYLMLLFLVLLLDHYIFANTLAFE